MECIELENVVVKCSKFSDAEAVIKKIEAKIKQVGNNKERQYYIQDILLEAQTLLQCLNYKSENIGCLKCHFISNRYTQEYKNI